MSRGDENNAYMIPVHSEDVDVSSADHTFGTPSVLWIGTGGDIEVQLEDDSTSFIYKNVPDGYAFPYRVKKIISAGTTAADIIGNH